MTRSDQHGRLHPLSKTRRLLTETTLVSTFRHPETIKFNGTQQPTWLSTPFVEDATSIDQDYFSLPSPYRDSKSDDMQQPTWSSAPFVEDSMSIDRDYFSLPSSSRDSKSDDA